MLEKSLEKMPSGKIVCAQNGNRYKWYHSDTKSYKYIPKAKRKFAERLALKTYNLLYLKDLMNEKKALEGYLKIHKSSYLSEELVKNNEDFRKLLSSQFKILSEELRSWYEESFEANSYSPDKLIHKSMSGNMVRSKAESMIDSLLYKHQIPFRYEALLVIGGTKIYPDFTIRHPVTGKLYYWEHFGMMDNPEYAKKAFEKMELYNSNGITPSVKLIITFETKDNPLSIDTVEKVISEYFL